MPKTTSFAWVKNVYSLGVTEGINSGFLYTTPLPVTTYTFNPVHNTPTFTRFIHAFTTYLSTRNFEYFNPLIHHLYPQSTAPINKKKKKE